MLHFNPSALPSACGPRGLCRLRQPYGSPNGDPLSKPPAMREAPCLPA